MNALIVFHSREREKQALAAALGAIEERANIRMRRLDPDASDARFEQEYIAPKDADAEWADVILIAAPECEELRQYLDLVARLKDTVKVVRLAEVPAKPLAH